MKPRPPKLMVCGYGRHGKDTFCEMMKPLKFVSSSMFVCNQAVYPTMVSRYGYKSIQECYDDRHNHREEWHLLVRKYNEHDRAKLARELYREYDIYCGIRWDEEFYAAEKEKLFDLSIWVDASRRLPPEDSSSITVTKDMCDIVIENNASLGTFQRKIDRLRFNLLRGVTFK